MISPVKRGSSARIASARAARRWSPRRGPRRRRCRSPRPSDGEAIDLAAVLDEGDGLGRFAERDRQAAGGERVERAGMAGAWPRTAASPTRDRVRRGRPMGLSSTTQPETSRLSRLLLACCAAHSASDCSVRDVDGIALRVPRPLRFAASHSIDRSRLREVALHPGERRALDVPPRRSARRAGSGAGAKCRFTRRAISPRRKRLLRSRAATTRRVPCRRAASRRPSRAAGRATCALPAP